VGEWIGSLAQLFVIAFGLVTALMWVYSVIVAEE